MLQRAKRPGLISMDLSEGTSNWPIPVFDERGVSSSGKGGRGGKEGEKEGGKQGGKTAAVANDAATEAEARKQLEFGYIDDYEWAAQEVLDQVSCGGGG
jgi:hypothetical protein